MCKSRTRESNLLTPGEVTIPIGTLPGLAHNLPIVCPLSPVIWKEMGLTSSLGTKDNKRMFLHVGSTLSLEERILVGEFMSHKNGLSGREVF